MLFHWVGIVFGKARELILGPKTWCPRLGQLSSSRGLYTGSMTETMKVDLDRGTRFWDLKSVP